MSAPGGTQGPNPYDAPAHAPPRQAGEAYGSVPFYRRNGPLSVVLLLSLVLAFVGPFVLGGVALALGKLGPAIVSTLIGSPLFAVCIVVLTGPVYFDAYDQHGKLKKWSIGNKVVAVLLLGGWLYMVIRTLI